MRQGWLAAVALAAGACAPALRAPKPLPGGQVPGGLPDQGMVHAAISRARQAETTRSPESMREAESAWLEAFSADRSSQEALRGVMTSRIWLAQNELTQNGRKEAARRAVEAGQWCQQVRPEDEECYYWLGAALGLQARESPSTGLSALPNIEECFARAVAGSPDVDHAGPDRAMAVFLVRAPGWPSGPGDPEKGVLHAREAVRRSPGFPPNLVALAEALHAVGDDDGSRRAAEEALEIAKRRLAEGDPGGVEWVRQAEQALGQKFH